MFENLSDRFSNVLRNLSGKGKISESNVQEAMVEVRTALLEADVSQDVVDKFCADVMENAVGQKVFADIRPGQLMIKIVYDELVKTMTGGEQDEPGIMLVQPGPTVVMMCGLQGSGKTTTCGKLAAYLKKRGRSVMLAAADLQRPAAVDQLRIVAEQVRDQSPGSARVLFYGEADKVAAYGKAVGVAVDVCRRALEQARKEGVDVLILDTAGRLHVNDALMEELEAVRAVARPHQTLLVVDAMTGQDAVASARAFHQRLAVSGVILSKFDSDARGGAALSVRRVTGAPIVFMGVGEKLDALEEFHAQRVAGRILGMGDVLSLVEKARDEVSEDDAEAMAEKMAKGQLTMDDFLKQMKALRRMGPMKSLLGMLPGVGGMLKDVNIEDKQLDRIEGIVHSMTREERKSVGIISHSRRKRIARGSGVSVDEVGKLVKQFEGMAKFTKQMAGMGMFGQMKALKEMRASATDDPMSAMGNFGDLPGMGAGGPGLGAGGMGGFPGFPSRGSTHTPSPKAKFKKRKK